MIRLTKEGGSDIAAAGEKQMGRPVGILGDCCSKMWDTHSFQSGFIVLGILFVAKDGYGWAFVHNCFLRAFSVTLWYAETGFWWVTLRMYFRKNYGNTACFP